MKISLCILPLALFGCSADANDQETGKPIQTEVVKGPKVSEAAAVAFPSGRSIADADGVRWTFDNHKLVMTQFGHVLISEGVPNEVDFAHVTAGRLDITYLQSSGSVLYVKKRYPEAVQVGSFGQMSEWAVSNKFGDNLVIYAAGGFTGQGITEGCTVLTELTATGPIELAAIPDSYSAPEMFGDRAEEIEGKIQNIVPNLSFEVRYTGSKSGLLKYVRKGNQYVRQGQAVLSHCGEE